MYYATTAEPATTIEPVVTTKGGSGGPKNVCPPGYNEEPQIARKNIKVSYLLKPGGGEEFQTIGFSVNKNELVGCLGVPNPGNECYWTVKNKYRPSGQAGRTIEMRTTNFQRNDEVLQGGSYHMRVKIGGGRKYVTGNGVWIASPRYGDEGSPESCCYVKATCVPYEKCTNGVAIDQSSRTQDDQCASCDQGYALDTTLKRCVTPAPTTEPATATQSPPPGTEPAATPELTATTAAGEVTCANIYPVYM